MKQRLIDATPIENKIAKWGEELSHDFDDIDELNGVYSCLAEIQSAPTIDPESLRATSQLVQDTYGVIKCKNCGSCVAIGGKNALHNAKREFRFCYNCGAKLEG